MDPFVVISFGKKVFRTRIIRHSLNPRWDEKLLFHVRRYETAFKVQLTVLDWDKLSSNDHVGEAGFNVSELIEKAPQMNERTGLYPAEEDGTHPMEDLVLPLSTAKEKPWETKHNPVLRIRYVSIRFFLAVTIHCCSLSLPANVSVQNTNRMMRCGNVSGGSTSNNTIRTTQGAYPTSN